MLSLPFKQVMGVEKGARQRARGEYIFSVGKALVTGRDKT